MTRNPVQVHDDSPLVQHVDPRHNPAWNLGAKEASAVLPTMPVVPTNLKLLVKCPDVDPLTRDACGYETRTSVSGAVTKIPLEAAWPYFHQGFLDADRPRSSVFSDDIVRATVGWAVADAGGKVLQEFDNAKDAEAARKNATQTVTFAI